MSLIKVPAFEPGEPAQLEVDCGKTTYCMATGRMAGLHALESRLPSDRQGED
ncbi:MAG TPA: hypothetical protein PLN31_09155 [Azoarcus taiwanensis]|nr:hypothetical protein [Azoarcus taiwanensis]